MIMLFLFMALLSNVTIEDNADVYLCNLNNYVTMDDDINQRTTKDLVCKNLELSLWSGNMMEQIAQDRLLTTK